MAEPQTRADVGELLRTIGFASAPGLLRQALDFTSTGRALAVCAAGWLLALVIAVVMGLVLGPIVQ